MNWSLILAFMAMAIGVLLLAGDFSAMNVALASIGSSLHVSKEAIQWVINSYMLTLSIFLIAAGKVADLFGRKRIFLYGLALFCIASFFGATAPNAPWLIGARAFQGIGAAMLWTSIIGICFVSVPEEKKSFAIGLILGAVGLAQAVGPGIGSLFTQMQSWRAILFLNIPLSILAGLIAYFKMPSEAITKGKKNVDYLSLVPLNFGLFFLIYALERSNNWGYNSAKFWGYLLFAFCLFFLFYVREKKIKKPPIPQTLMTKKSLLIPSLIMALIAPAFFVETLFLPQYMQKFLGFDGIEAALGIIPLFIIWALVSPIAGDLCYYMSERSLIVLAAAAIAVGAFLFGFVGMQSDYYFLLPGMIISGLGYGFGFSSITSAGIRSVREAEASLAGGILYTFQIVGGILGLAIATFIFTTIGKGGLYAITKDHAAFEGFLNQIESIHAILSRFPKEIQARLEYDLHKAYARAFFANMLFCSLLAACGAVLSLTFFNKSKKR